MKLYLFKPYDVLTFGGLKNFSAGESHIQRAEFPPPIMRFFHLFRKVFGVFLYKDGQVCMPMPADCVSERKKESPEAKPLKMDIPPLIRGELKAYEQAKGFISWKDFWENYKNGKSFQTYQPFIKSELRVGIALDKGTRTAREGMLYSEEFLRFDEGSMLAVLGEGYEGKGIEKVGGERRVAFCKEADNEKLEVENVKVIKGKYYKFYCLTHLFVEGGLEQEREIKLFGSGLKFKVLWFFGTSEFVSGYTKPFIQMLKPGSVLWLLALDEGGTKGICQIDSKPEVNDIERSFLERGWNSGILLEVKQ